MIARAALLLRTVRHLQPGQIATRAARTIERTWWRLTHARPPHAPAPPRGSAGVPAGWSAAVPAAPPSSSLALLQSTFTFLNITRVRPPWNPPDVPHLWRFHLHYFDYLRDLAALANAGQRPAAFAKFRELALSWIDANRTLGGDGWHPYTVSLRVANWCDAAEFFRPELDADPDFARRLDDSIAAQTRFLSRHLETDVRGNHIMENARALARVSVYFAGPEAEQWRALAVRILQREVPEQILADGGHFERAPGYHVRMMEVLAETAALLGGGVTSGAGWKPADQPAGCRRSEAPPSIATPPIGAPPSRRPVRRLPAGPEPRLNEVVARMQRFLDAIVPPNGRLPLLKDTVLPDARRAESPPLHNQPSRLRGQPSQWLAASGFAVMRDDARGDHLIADFGRIGPDYLPAHAHADMFSFELTIGGRPVIVDSGVYEYETGEWRQWFRSTAAHNTVTVDGRDQSEMWGNFRVGRRARPRDVVWYDEPQFTAIRGTHDGYAPLMHTRWIVGLKEHRLWLVLDLVERRALHRIRSYVHVHPEGTLPGFTALNATVERERGWYSERFGEKRANDVLVLTPQAPGWFGYVVAAEPVAAAMTVEGEACRVEANGVTLIIKADAITVARASA